jgi:hypothetical protein
MMDWLLEKLKELAVWLGGWLVKVVMWFLGLMSGLGETMLEGIRTGLASVVPASYLNALDGYLAGINYFFPLTELMGMLGALFALWVVCLLYRLVKSWIPTVSGGG